MLALQLVYLKRFFEVAKIGPSGNAVSILNALYDEQIRASQVIVVHPSVPLVYPPSTAFSGPSSFFSTSESYYPPSHYSGVDHHHHHGVDHHGPY